MDEFRHAIQAAGLSPPEVIKPGKLHRFPGIGKANGNKAAVIWEAAEPATDHLYLTAKGIKPHGARLHDGRRVIPMRDGGKLYSLQYIDADGGKRFFPGGRVSGCYYSIGKPSGIVCIAEGFATAASVHQATGYAVAVAFNAGNLAPVAKTLRQRLPDARIVICGEND